MNSILLIDDDKSFRGALAAILKKQFHIIEADGVTTAMKILQQNKPDLICSDYRMNDGTGIDVLTKIRQKDSKQKFILMSSNIDFSVKLSANVLGAEVLDKVDSSLIQKIVAMMN